MVGEQIFLSWQFLKFILIIDSHIYNLNESFNLIIRSHSRSPHIDSRVCTRVYIYICIPIQAVTSSWDKPVPSPRPQYNPSWHNFLTEARYLATFLASVDTGRDGYVRQLASICAWLRARPGPCWTQIRVLISMRRDGRRRRKKEERGRIRR